MDTDVLERRKKREEEEKRGGAIDNLVTNTVKYIFINMYNVCVLKLLYKILFKAY